VWIENPLSDTLALAERSEASYSFKVIIIYLKQVVTSIEIRSLAFPAISLLNHYTTTTINRKPNPPIASMFWFSREGSRTQAKVSRVSTIGGWGISRHSVFWIRDNQIKQQIFLLC
jgi:hypothetical protein